MASLLGVVVDDKRSNIVAGLLVVLDVSSIAERERARFPAAAHDGFLTDAKSLCRALVLEDIGDRDRVNDLRDALPVSVVEESVQWSRRRAVSTQRRSDLFYLGVLLVDVIVDDTAHLHLSAHGAVGRDVGQHVGRARGERGDDGGNAQHGEAFLSETSRETT